MTLILAFALYFDLLKKLLDGLASLLGKLIPSKKR
jgi:hypothetical protein